MVKSSNYRGVTLFRPTGKWRAQVRLLQGAGPSLVFSMGCRTA